MPASFAEKLDQLFASLNSALPSKLAPANRIEKVQYIAHAGHYPDELALAQFFKTVRGPIERARSNGELLNVWSVARVRTDELRNTAILNWLLDLNESHGRGSRFWESLLRRIADRLPAGFPHERNLTTNYVTRVEDYPLSNSMNRIDIRIENDAFLIFIEAKIKASERENQIKDYLELLSRSAGTRHSFLLLVCGSSEAIPARPNVVIITWGEIAKMIDDVISGEEATFLNKILRQLSEHFASHSKSVRRRRRSGTPSGVSND